MAEQECWSSRSLLRWRRRLVFWVVTVVALAATAARLPTEAASIEQSALVQAGQSPQAVQRDQAATIVAIAEVSACASRH